MYPLKCEALGTTESDITNKKEDSILTEYRTYGYSHGTKIVVAAKVSSDTSAISIGDIVVFATESIGDTAHARSKYIRKWTSATDEVVGVALESSTVPAESGASSILIVLAIPGAIFMYPSPGVTHEYCFQCCDIRGAQSIDHKTDTFQNVWIVDVDGEREIVCVMFRGLFDEFAEQV
jgi:hypothetical protein